MNGVSTSARGICSAAHVLLRNAIDVGGGFAFCISRPRRIWTFILNFIYLIRHTPLRPDGASVAFDVRGAVRSRRFRLIEVLGGVKAVSRFAPSGLKPFRGGVTCSGR
jgi:hypothetical protein